MSTSLSKTCRFEGWGNECESCTTGKKGGCTFKVKPVERSEYRERAFTAGRLSVTCKSSFLVVFLFILNFSILDLTEQGYEMLNTQERRQIFLTLAGIEDVKLNSLRHFFFRAIRRVMSEEGPDALQTLFEDDSVLKQVAQQEVPEEFHGVFPAGIPTPTYMDVLTHLIPKPLPARATSSSRVSRHSTPAALSVLASSSSSMVSSAAVSASAVESDSENESSVQDQLVNKPRVDLAALRRETPRSKESADQASRRVKAKLTARPVDLDDVPVVPELDDVDMDAPAEEDNPSGSKEPSPEV